MQKDQEVLKYKCDEAKQESDLSKANLKYMTQMYEKTNETVSSLKAAMEASHKDKATDELLHKISELTSQISDYKKTMSEKEESYKANERDLKKLVMESEKKTHETWMAYKESERKVTALKSELNDVKQNLITLDASFKKGEEQYREAMEELEYERGLRQQLELDNQSALDAKGRDRPLSRNSVNSSRYEASLKNERGSMSPFDSRRRSVENSPQVREEIIPSKPVDPLRAPPPANTYMKGLRKSKVSSLRAEKESTPPRDQGYNAETSTSMTDPNAAYNSENPMGISMDEQLTAFDPSSTNMDPSMMGMLGVSPLMNPGMVGWSQPINTMMNPMMNPMMMNMMPNAMMGNPMMGGSAGGNPMTGNEGLTYQNPMAYDPNQYANYQQMIGSNMQFTNSQNQMNPS